MLELEVFDMELWDDDESGNLVCNQEKAKEIEVGKVSHGTFVVWEGEC